MTIGRIWRWLHAKNWRTWLGHLAIAFAIMAVGVAGWESITVGLYANAVHWLLRELPGLVQAIKAGDTEKLADGLGDLAGPMIGIAVYVVLFG
ncbi:hypothetical protein LCGC14_2284660 [marine sediment metagenome]|uniref:Uncharacterized protein n=1 Tax=marine sediment metagenome TaxID=412755 RepID=A0A0F9CSW6_9ZZZZ